MITVPIQREGQVMGALQLINRREGSTFSEPDLAILDYLGRECAEYLRATGEVTAWPHPRASAVTGGPGLALAGHLSLGDQLLQVRQTLRSAKGYRAGAIGVHRLDHPADRPLPRLEAARIASSRAWPWAR